MIGKLETNMIKELGEFKSGVTNNLNNDFEKLNDRIERKLNLIND